ncbi:MAG: hypothetical protein WCS79_00660 [Paludibacter sp.]|jgi:hypothetical protein
MKTFKIKNVLIACFTTLLFTACTADIVRDPSPVTNPNSTNVYFGISNTNSPVLSIDQTSFKVAIGRKVTDKAQTVALTAGNVYGDKFQIPATVTFAAGEDSVDIEIVVKDLELMKKYHISISIDQEQTLPYAIQTVLPRLELSVIKEDFAPYANGTYTSAFFEANWPQTLEYSPSTKLYRFKDCWATGYNVTFKWDEAAKPGEVNIIGTTNSAGTYIYLQTGYIDATYGMVSAYYPTADINYYNSNTKTFTFPIKWYVSAGSFGVYADTYLITQVL